jgi:type II secretory pathway pseudopilin PulG
MKHEQRFAIHRWSLIAHRSRLGFTLIEMLTTVAVLIIILGLMVNLARYVRDRSAQQLTREVLAAVQAQMAQYLTSNGQYPPVTPILAADQLDAFEAALDEPAKANNEQLVAALKLDYRLHNPQDTTDPLEKKCPISVYDHKTLRDAWGRPIVFMPRQHSLIGLAPSRQGQDQYFFFSAGPDRKYLTRQDNLYSYETLEQGK